MEAVASIAQRVWQIQSQIAQFRGVTPPALGTTATGTATGTSSGLSFDTALAMAQDVAGTTAIGSGADRLNAQGIPVELAGYGNGRIPADALSPVAGTTHRLWEPAARSLDALIADAASDGVAIGITDSYRSYESQVDVAARKGLYSQGGLAAVPGTSKHGWGLAVDLDLSSGALAWMRENGERYGFVEDTPRESWHWGYHPTS